VSEPRSPARAASLTVLWTALVPYVWQSVLGLLLSFLRPANSGPQVPSWMFVYTLLHLFGGLIYSLALIFWARHQLLTKLREAVSDSAPITALGWKMRLAAAARWVILLFAMKWRKPKMPQG
jgi:hypothetical protein